VNDGPNTPPESIGASPPDVILVLSPFAAKVLSKVIEEAHAEDIVDLPDSALRDLGLTVPDDDEDSDDFFDALTERIEGLFLALPREIDDQLSRGTAAKPRRIDVEDLPTAEPQVSDAERIAQKMAASAKEAVDNG
jgi:hypothetical protein